MLSVCCRRHLALLTVYCSSLEPRGQRTPCAVKWEYFVNFYSTCLSFLDFF
uniref:Uncharacterized protein n=1 Tax=Anguilla anguilla TaxID=7936 RepID=A0A0E9QP05_ANGAN